MKLLNCHIENFGILSNSDYSFNEGLNTIKKDNGTGKSTFADFIKAMFYGLEPRKNTKNLLDRKKYEPWQGGSFGGNITFEINGKEYKIERFFHKKESDDVFKLYDLKTNLESQDFSKNIGEEIFKLNKEAFERSVFISGQNIETKMNDSINAKLGNILESENDINTSESAIKQLDDSIKFYQKTGGRGEINKKIAKKTELEKRIEDSKIDKKNFTERQKQYAIIKEQIEKAKELENKYKMMQKEILEEETKKSKLENYNTIKSDLKKIENNIEENNEFFKNVIPSYDEIDLLSKKCMQIEKYKTELKNYEISSTQESELKKLDTIFLNGKINEKVIETKREEYNNIKEIDNKIIFINEQNELTENKSKEINKKIKAQKIIAIIILIFSIIFAIVGVVLFVKEQIKAAIIYVIATLILGSIFAAKSFIIYNKIKKDRIIKKEIEKNNFVLKEHIDKKEELQKSLESFLNRFTNNVKNEDTLEELTKIKYEFKRYIELKNNINNLLSKQEYTMQELNKLENDTNVYLYKYFNELTKPKLDYVDDLKLKKKDLERLQEEFDKKIKLKERFEKDNNVEELEKFEQISETKLTKKEVEEKLENIEKEIANLNDEKNDIKNKIENLENKLDDAIELESDLDEVNKKIETMQENVKILEQTKKLLEMAKDSFSSHYLGSMKESFLENYKLINGSKIDANIDVDLNIKINERGESKDLQYFSTGYKDLIYICIRLSLIQALFEEEKPFIILDDPFTNLDETKIKNAIQLLNSISKEYQIIYFICHNSRI